MPARRHLEAARRAFDAALDAVPGSIVERVTATTAPLTRYSGRTRAGAAALASALTVLAQPPRHRRHRRSALTAADIADAVDQPVDVVAAWIDAGLLGAPQSDGTWSRDALDRATLMAFATRHGSSEEDLRSALADGRLPLLVLEHAISGEPRLTARRVADSSGLPLDTAVSIWRALGLAVEDADAPMFGRSEVAALRTLNAMRAVFTDEDLLEAASVVGRAMADVSAASGEIFRRRLTARFLQSDASDIDVALRLAAMTDLLVPPLGPLLEVVLRHHLIAGARAEAVTSMEESDVAAAGERRLTVAFADLVGFTTVSERMTALEVSRLAARLLHLAETVLPAHDARIVKSIGDAVMFTAPDPVSGCRAALDLIAAARDDESLPPVRAGAAHGPVLRAYADCFGRTVNVAARLCAAAHAGQVYLDPGDASLDDEALHRAGLAVHRLSPLKLKGIRQRVAALRVVAG